MSDFKRHIEEKINNPDICYTGSKLTVLESDLKNLQKLLIETAEQIDKLNNKLRK